MIQLPYAATGGLDELATRFGDLYASAPDGPIKEGALALSIACMKLPGENGALYWNENRQAIQDAITQFQATTPTPGGFIVPTGTAIAVKAHYARTWARYLRRVDLGDNSYLLEFVGIASIWAYWAALWDNNTNGVDEILVP